MAAQLHTEGRQFMQEVAFSEQQSVPANFYVGLCTDLTIAENASLASLTELVDPSDTDYARYALASSAVGWTSASTGTNDRKITSNGITFSTATSGVTWTKAESWFLATTIDDSGKLIMSGPLNSGSGWTVSAGGAPLEFDIQFIFPG